MHFFLLFYAPCLQKRMRLLEQSLQFLFPETCIHCGAPKVHELHLCETCWLEIPSTLQSCTPPKLIQKCWTLGRYDSPLGSLLRRCKYKPERGILDAVAQRITRSKIDIPRSDQVTHVPTPFRRIARRGFDQAQVLAKRIASSHNIPHASLLKRLDATPQSSRTERDRQKNLSFRFEAVRPIQRSILLVDDIFTTGSTLEACAIALLDQGAEQINAIVVCTR
ncbi:MAG: phosphoribosyltransferase family protein [Myxococcota bacterium]|nr:phosphoribosyltransferase family protein [Myxococcota bacterium]